MEAINMASKIEISEVEKLIEDNREANPLFTNGLISALNVLTDEPISLIDVVSEDGDLVGSFSWALDQAENKGKRLVMSSHKGSVLCFENHTYVMTSDLRGREVLTEFPMYMIKALNWKLVSKK
jgi:hypothetical protein